MKMNAQHTPGPWRATAWGETISIDSPHGNYSGIARLNFSGNADYGIPPQLETANARLIAAAPDMLEALESLFEECAMVHKHWGEGNNTEKAAAAISKAQAAIRKARGE
jgi:hypothetical protein